MPKGSDTEIQGLLDLANAGDREARGRLLDHACERLLKLSRAMLARYPAVRRWEATDDVHMKAMMRLHRALETVQPESVRHFFNLAATQIRRELLDFKKHYYGPQGLGSNHATDHQSPDEPGGRFDRTVHEPEDISEWAEFHEEADNLPEDLREVVNLLFYQGLSHQEAADVLGISLATVKRRWQAARVHLHDKLGGTS
jgi:RNA polymerase sigma factor (sigma-70 family)